MVSNNQKDEVAVEESTQTDLTFLERYAQLRETDRVRGGTPAALPAKCLRLCRTYLGGSWSRAEVGDIYVQRISGGVTNQLYKVELWDSKTTTIPIESNSIYGAVEPRIVAIKLYQSKLMPNNHRDDPNERLGDVITLTVLSQAGICPRVYGIFADGFVQAHCEHEQFRPKHQQNPSLLRQLAHTLARAHHLQVPIRKDHFWMEEMVRTSFDEAYTNETILSLIKQHNLKHLAVRDLRKEFQDLAPILSWLNRTPRVFSHNDFRRGNILVVSEHPQQEIRLVDFEYSSYGWRGYDLATFILEWGREKFDSGEVQLPEDSVIGHFVRLYSEACNREVSGYSRSPDNSPDQIVTETKLCALFNFLFLAAFMLRQKQSFIEAIPFDLGSNLKTVDNLVKTYYTVKEKLRKDGTIHI